MREVVFLLSGDPRGREAGRLQGFFEPHGEQREAVLVQGEEHLSKLVHQAARGPAPNALRTQHAFMQLAGHTHNEVRQIFLSFFAFDVIRIKNSDASMGKGSKVREGAMCMARFASFLLTVEHVIISGASVTNTTLMEEP